MPHIKDEIEQYKQELYERQEEEKYLEKLNRIRVRRGAEPLTYEKHIHKSPKIGQNILDCSFRDRKLDIPSPYRKEGTFREKVTAEKIISLSEGEIFVYGSKLGGFSTDGAARYAYEKFEAQPDIVEGLTGRAYALPVLDAYGNRLCQEDIVKRFINLFDCARQHPNLTFLLTKVGTGTGGYRISVMTDIFHVALYEYLQIGKFVPINIAVPPEFARF